MDESNSHIRGKLSFGDVVAQAPADQVYRLQWRNAQIGLYLSAPGQGGLRFAPLGPREPYALPGILMDSLSDAAIKAFGYVLSNRLRAHL